MFYSLHITLAVALMTSTIASDVIDFEVVSFATETHYINKKKIKVNNTYFDELFKKSFQVEDSNEISTYNAPKVFRNNIRFNQCNDDVFKTHRKYDVMGDNDYHWVTYNQELCAPVFPEHVIYNYVSHWDSGQKNRITPLHWDRNYGFLTCYSGLKYVILYPPSQLHMLYLQEDNNKTGLPFIIEEPINRTKFPKTNEAKALCY